MKSLFFSLLIVSIPLIVFATSYSKVRHTQMIMGQIKSELYQYQADCHKYPKSDDGLKVLREPPSKEECSAWGPTPYMDCNAGFFLKVRDRWAKLFDSTHQLRCFVDAWENEIHYRLNGDKFELLSYGGDNKPGGDGIGMDISTKTDE